MNVIESKTAGGDQQPVGAAMPAAVGGLMAQLDKTFPTNDCAM